MQSGNYLNAISEESAVHVSLIPMTWLDTPEHIIDCEVTVKIETSGCHRNNVYVVDPI